MRKGGVIRVGFLTRYRFEMASSRIRAYEYIPFLEELGFACRVLDYPEKPTLRAKADYARQAFALARWADLLVLQRLALKHRHFDALRRLNPAIVYDLDDALNLPPDSVAGDPQVERVYRNLAERIERAISLSCCVITASEYLAGYAAGLNRRVHVIPNSVDTRVYRPGASPRGAGPGVVGWIGGPEAGRDFKAIGDLKGFLEALRGKAILRVVGARPPLPEAPHVILEDWSLERVMEQLHGFDIGIMPLNDTPRSRGRCSYKAIQYMGVGIPVVASPVGGALEVVEDRRTGLFAATTAEWVDAVTSLLGDGGLRARLGAAGYEKVKAKYCYEVNAPLLAEILREVHGRK
jgi:glycosyltransferase involved in cell wall biosynthesis